MSFAHLEVHSHLTLLGATASPAELAARAAADGLGALALTDTGVLYGAAAFTRACQAAGVRPVVGMAVPAVGVGGRGSGDGGTEYERPPRGPERQATQNPTERAEAPARLVLLARNEAGYRSLCYLSSLLQAPVAFARSASADSVLSCAEPVPTPNPQSLASLTWDDLRAHHDGLICLSGGSQGWIDRYLAAGDLSAGQVYAARLAGIYGEDAVLALELPPPKLDGTQDLSHAREIVALGRRLGLPVAAVQPVYCLAPGEAARLRLLAAIRCNCRLADVPPGELPGSRPDAEVHWLSPQEVTRRFAAFPEAERAAGEVAARCGNVLPDGRPIWPAISLPPGQSPDEALRELALKGLQAKYAASALTPNPSPNAGRGESSPPPLSGTGSGVRSGSPLPPKGGSGQTSGPPLPRLGEGLGVRASPRLDAELTVIASHGYAPLFLAVADIVRFAREHGIPVSTRGSVANSLVAYCAGITDVDPVAHDLLFERFLSPARADAPDIDLDLCSRRRDEVLEYVRQAYGAERVALVGAMNTMRAPSAVRAAAKAYGLDERQASMLVSRLPRWYHHRPDVDAIKQAGALSPADERPDTEDANAEEPEAAAPVQSASSSDDPFSSLMSPDSLVSLSSLLSSTPAALGALLADARALVGQPDHLSSHAGGVVITPGPLTDVVPVQWAPKGFLVTQYEHGDVAGLGLAKLDLLGIRALTVLADAAEMVREGFDPGFRLEEITPGDRLTGDLLERGDTIGVFQCESDGARATLRKLRARDERDLAIANAFFKPGPATGGMAAHFVKRYRGEEKVTYLHPALEPILAPTKGVLIFQEQVLRIVRDIAGLSWAEADHVRRGMSRMAPTEMAGLAQRFVVGCQRRPPAGPGLSPEQAQQLWEQVAAFAGFGFNQGHATAYAAVSYRSAYLRAHWPAAFLAARLADAGGFHHPVIYMADALRLGIVVRGPHVNHSVGRVRLESVPLRGTRDWRLAAQSPISNPAARDFLQSQTIWLSLGQVRDLRHASIRAIVAERERGGAYASLADLLGRVDLQAKEVEHLVKCGALDGIGASRAAMLAEAGAVTRGRSARKRARDAGAIQLSFDLATPDSPGGPAPTPAESPAQRCEWERHVLGLPLTALIDPLALLPGGDDSRAPLPPHTPLSALFAPATRAAQRPAPHPQPPTLNSQPPTPVTLGLRLPGWTGGPGFFFWDGATLVTARLPKGTANPEPWRLIAVRGRPAGDGWGTWWLQVDEVRPLG